MLCSVFDWRSVWDYLLKWIMGLEPYENWGLKTRAGNAECTDLQDLIWSHSSQESLEQQGGN